MRSRPYQTLKKVPYSTSYHEVATSLNLKKSSVFDICKLFDHKNTVGLILFHKKVFSYRGFYCNEDQGLEKS